ncbi:chorismate mutase [Corynebacteriaceae bacterium 6-324]
MDTSSESGLPEAHNNSGQDELAADISAGNNADIRMPSGTDDPLSDAEIQRYREEINKMDRIILDAVKRRTKVSQAIGKTRMGSGGTRLVHTREISILNQFRDELGEEGPAIASALLRMGRGKLG